jgi:hypothetical protein
METMWQWEGKDVIPIEVKYLWNMCMLSLILDAAIYLDFDMMLNTLLKVLLS